MFILESAIHLKIKRGLRKMNMTKIRLFFEKRFNRTPETDKLYFEEWVYRFRTFDEKTLRKLMDDQTWKIYQEVLSA